MKIAYTGWTWLVHHKDNQKYELEQSIKECKYLGYDYIENFAFIRDYYADNPQELVELQRKYGVEIVNLYGHFAGVDVEEDFEKSAKQIDFLAEIGGKWFNCQHSGYKEKLYTEGPLDLEMLQKIAGLSDRLGKYALEKGIKLCFHPHAGTCVFTQAQIDWFAQHTNPDYVFFCVDTAHSTIAGINPAGLMLKYRDRLQYVHLKDVCGYTASKAPDERARMKSFRALGLGTVDFKEVYETLREIGYEGVLCVELDSPEVCNFHSAMTSRKYIRDVFKL